MIPRNLLRVPWYDSAEWKFVYHHVFDDDNSLENKRKGLKVLQVWQDRMPSLFTYIEGTLILLKAMLEVDDLNQEIRELIERNAIMRFLSICVDDHSKGIQDSLMQVARNGNIPMWMVNLRHDYCHGHGKRYGAYLRRALKIALNWLKENYWDVLYPQLYDSRPKNQSPQKETLKNMIDLYCEIALNLQKSNKSLEFKHNLEKKLKKFKIGIEGSLVSIMERLVTMQIHSKKTPIFCIIDFLMKNGALLEIPNFEQHSKISSQTLKIWLPMLRMLQYYDRLVMLLVTFVKICNEKSNQERCQKSAVWVKTICEVLSSDQKDYLLQNADEVNLERGLTKLVDFSLKQMDSYLHIYIRALMTAAKCDKTFKENMCRAFQVFNVEETKHTSSGEYSDKIFSMEDVKKIVGEDIVNKLSHQSEPSKQWEEVDDSFKFDGLPIAVHPDFTFHPVSELFKSD